MSILVDRAIENAGLDDVLVKRREGRERTIDVSRLRGADLLVLGALADRIRAEEVGPQVRIVTAAICSEPGVATVPPGGVEMTGLELLRRVAILRLTGSRGATVRVDFGRCGLELAQIALGFGANELMGRIVSKSGAAFAEGALMGVGKKSRLELADIVKRREIEGFVRLAGREPVFVDEMGRSETSAEPCAEEDGSWS
jgi:hypothetical protein